MATIGDNLRILRMERGMTQEDIANRLGITRFSIANYETGRRAPSVSTLKKYAQMFGMPLDQITETDYPSNVISLMELVERVFSDPDIPLKHKENVLSDIMKCFLVNKEKSQKKGSL